ncbi:coiled-coil domain-containing protein 94 [Tetranychus urticae]|uniref:coiled-coil domain-containing protein 94 n=1 Tax=Tetranychus urticae TaxID=32264 RepID=UPI00077BF4DD|nr:coiled-coil domain-containing protein 94 [Tetranychus urticae]
MSERKVLNKYYPPDFDPSKVPRLRHPKTRQYTVRIMVPFNMQCNTCGDYIAKAKKFNARKETIENESYLGLKVFRFYFKCPVCMAEITFKTDPKSYDYELEHGATRNFQALRLSEQKALEEAKEKEEEVKSNPIKLLEERQLASRREMEELEELEELKDQSDKKVVVNFEEILAKKRDKAKEEAILEARRQEEEDEALIKSIMAEKAKLAPSTSTASATKTSSFTSFAPPKPSTSKQSMKRKLSSLIKIKEPDRPAKKPSD